MSELSYSDKDDDLAIDWLESNDREKSSCSDYVINASGGGRRSLARLLAEVRHSARSDAIREFQPINEELTAKVAGLEGLLRGADAQLDRLKAAIVPLNHDDNGVPYRSCRLCDAGWDDGKPHRHKVTCALYEDLLPTEWLEG
jgi:hypothetical protein